MVYQKYCNECDHQHHVGEFDRKIRRKGMNGESKLSKRDKSKLSSLLCLSFLSCSFIWVSRIFGLPFSLSCLFTSNSTQAKFVRADVASASVVTGGAIQCDRSHFRTDICYMKGDIRTNSSSSSIFLYTRLQENKNVKDQELQHELIRPYTRKWETSVMNTVDQLHLISKQKPFNSDHKCEVVHDVPAIFFSTGGYTGNVYHEFNDGLIPLYITSRHYDKKVVFVILEYHAWWYMKYGKVLSQLSDYPLIDFKSDSRTHCFREAIVGLKIHDELAIDSHLMEKNETILDFRDLIGRAFEPRTVLAKRSSRKRPRAVILSRTGSRSITNEKLLVKLAEKIGFDVRVLKPRRDTDLATLYKAISSSDLMVGVHGAAMTHFLFQNLGSILIQVIPLGTDWAAETYYGEPAKKLGLKYIGYKIDPTESSLYRKYGKNDPILKDPKSVNQKGWKYTKEIYLDDQYVTLDLRRFKTILVRAFVDCLTRSLIIQ